MDGHTASGRYSRGIIVIANNLCLMLEYELLLTPQELPILLFASLRRSDGNAGGF
jgi:hypothetical protein